MDDVTRPYGYKHSSPIHPASKSIFTSLEATDSTRSLPYPSVSLQFLSSSPWNKRGEADGSRRSHQYSPVYRCLANENKLKTALPREHPLVGSSCQKPRLDHKFLKIRLISNSSNQIFGYKFDLRVRPVFPTQKKIDCLLGKTVDMLKDRHVGFLISREAHVTLKAWLQWRMLYHWVVCTLSHSNGIWKH